MRGGISGKKQEAHGQLNSKFFCESSEIRHFAKFKPLGRVEILDCWGTSLEFNNIELKLIVEDFCEDGLIC